MESHTQSPRTSHRIPMAQSRHQGSLPYARHAHRIPGRLIYVAMTSHTVHNGDNEHGARNLLGHSHRSLGFPPSPSGSRPSVLPHTQRVIASRLEMDDMDQAT